MRSTPQSLPHFHPAFSLGRHGLTCVTIALLGITSHPGAAAEPAIDFNRDIRPLLAENCFHCHGPDGEQRQADLRLDTEDGAHATINVDRPQESELLRRVRSNDPDLQMPPPDSNRTLSSADLELLERWIAAGAPWGVHWSFTPIEAPHVPEIDPQMADVHVRNPIDAFVQRRLFAENLLPSPEADRRTLLRRVSLDLTGLPPTPSEMDTFLNDPAPDAYERQVERLLNSPAYGERMAWDWLDAARYADSNGYQGDRERTMWPWRDWVVQAFNENLPYDQFTVWQLAGDLLPDATFEQKLATGFCRNHMINGEGGRIAEENRVDYVMDMSETMGTVWLGLTLNCCRCHDHKFDPLTRANYYGFFAFFDQTPVTGGGGDPQTAPVLEAPTTEQQKLQLAFETQLTAVNSAIETRGRELATQQSDWEAMKRTQLQLIDLWSPLNVFAASALHQTLTLQADGSVLAAGPNPAQDTYTVKATSGLQEIRSIRLEALRDAAHTKGGLARSDSGNFVLTEFEVSVERAGTDSATSVAIAGAVATHEQGGLKIANAFDGQRTSGWAILGGEPIDKVDHAANFYLREPLALMAGDQLTFVLRHESPHVSHNIGRFRILLSATENVPLDRPQSNLLTALNTPVAQRSASQQQLLQETFLKTDEPYQQLLNQRGQIEKQQADLRNAVAKVMVMQDLQEPRQTFLLDRGLYNAPGDLVSAHTPQSLPPLPASEPVNRLTLARWLVADEQPLTARVTVNRFWQQVFGIGLVKTSEDFGTQGEVPMQLDLLNWLADDFRKQGWDVKHLMRLIVTSHTYRQSSRVSKELYERDPANRLFARAPRYRMPYWMVRDQVLLASGLLVNEQGGPAVNGYQPTGIWEEATFGGKQYKQDHGDALYRRSLYTFWRRIVAPTMFFDSASRQTCSVKVARTNTPLQALLTQNDVTYVEAARVLAQRVLPQAADDQARLDFISSAVLARSLSESEQSILVSGLNRTRETFSHDPAAAIQLLQQGESPRDESLDTVEHASWTAVCLAIFNLDETLTRE